MIDFIRTWANQIIVAVIIATIFEMLLPNGNNKKYIKMVIGIYVLFTLIQPIASKVTGKEFEILSNYEKYFDEDILETSSDNFKKNNSKLIEQAYIDTIKTDIKTKIERKGYKINSCNINIVATEEDYGVIESIVLNLQNKEENKNTSNGVKIKKVEVNIGNEEVAELSNLTDKEKQDIIQYLSEEYSIDKTQIVIN